MRSGHCPQRSIRMERPISTSNRRGFFAAMLTMVGCFIGAIAWVYLSLLRQPDAVNLDLTVVQSDERAVPFFDLVFDYTALGDEWSFVDPYVRRRGKSFLWPDRLKNIGPHDLLGFRNDAIPSHPDVIVLGDSISYGINVDIDSNWPSRFAEITGHSVYNMSLPGWGGLSIRYMFEKAIRLDPALILVALYMGNDSLENALMAYSTPYWDDYRPRSDIAFEDLGVQVRTGGILETLRISDEPEVVMPFQVAMRFDVNDPERLIASLGYEIQNRVITEIIEIARRQDVQVAFTIIPTKEATYEDLLSNGKIKISPEFRQLLANEASFQQQLIDTIERSGGAYIDVSTPLSDQTADGALLYPMTGDGHPSSLGYKKIAKALNDGLPTALPATTDPGFWSRSGMIPGASLHHASAVSSYLARLNTLGFRGESASISGYLGSVGVVPGFVAPVVSGWSFDRENPSSATTLAVVVDDRVVLVGQTSGSRKDVEEAFGLKAADQPINTYRLQVEGTCEALAASEIRMIAISEVTHSYKFLPPASGFNIDCSAH